MANVEFPKPLKQLLEASDLQAPIRALADRTGEILADNKLLFFPDYTDHGIDHINRVLKSEVELVPKQVWENSKSDSDPQLLRDADAAVIIGATLLHDLAMHLRADGFRELIGQNSRFEPLPWFKDSHEGHLADRPWNDLWDDYMREVRRFSDRDLANVIGESPATLWKFQDLPSDQGNWDRNHQLIIGEFIRRHHARIAHEIAIYGFPGIPAGQGEAQFPAIGNETGHPLMRLADLIGLTARSHGMSMRVCQAYLESSALYPSTPRPMDTAVLYPMALLRVADYLQIDRQRAPAVLLQLRNPQSPVSVLEWKKHRAVENVGPATDPRGKMVTVSTEVSLTLYLQLRQLLSGLQTELDQSTAVLDEAYGTLTELGLNRLNLSVRRVHTNLNSPAFHRSLPYVPSRTGFSADPNLLTLLVEPLYGKEPSVGVRELIQNAVDAVSELETWCALRKIELQSLDLPIQPGDVLVEFIKEGPNKWLLRVRDRGIGMSSETIQNYFLRAGASFRRSAEWSKEFVNEQGQPRVVRAGRFGIGAFAIFLLGSSFRMLTRHAAAELSDGYSIEASANNQLIEIRRRDNLKIGTTIEVDLDAESVEALRLDETDYSSYNGLAREIDWFCWDWPTVRKRVVRGKKAETLQNEFAFKIRKGRSPLEWAVIHPKGFDAVYWTFLEAPILVCNGLKISDPGEDSWREDAEFAWPKNTELKRPNVAVVDSAANLPLTTQRYRLIQKTVPFIDDLVRDVLLSYIAHALVCGPSSPRKALISEDGHPLRSRQLSQYGGDDSVLEPFARGLLRWCFTRRGFVPAEPWLYTLLNANSCFVFGGLGVSDESYVYRSALMGTINQRVLLPPKQYAVLPWHGVMRQPEIYGLIHRFEEEHPPETWPSIILGELVSKGIPALGQQLKAARVIAFADREFTFPSNIEADSWRPERESSFEDWADKGPRNDHMRCFEAKTGLTHDHLPLESTVESLIAAGQIRSPRQWARIPQSYRGRTPRPPDCVFAAKIDFAPVSRAPNSSLARLWNEFLGPVAIPFNRRDRENLIAKAGERRELSRHIKAWRRMKRKGISPPKPRR